MQANIQLEFIRLLCQNEGVAVATMSHPMRTLRRSKSKNRDSFYFVILSYEKAGSAAITESVPPLGILQLEEP
jgi:hypothetical protein